MADNVSLRQLRYFVAAAKAGQFSMAARDEHVSQSTITNAVLALEEELGIKLFDRLAQGVALTAEGQDFFHNACHILDSVRDAVHNPRFRKGTLRGSVSVAASYTVLGYFLPELLARFRASYPDVEIDLRDTDRPGIEQAVAKAEVDLGVAIISNVQRIDRFSHAVLVRSRRQLWVAPTHPLAQIPAPSLADIARHPYIQVTADEAEASTLAYWKNRKSRPRIVFRTSSIEAVRGLVAHGFGVTVLSDMVFRPWSLEGKRIEARPILDAVPHMEVGVLWHPSKPLSPPAEAFLQFLLHAYGS
ncbi:LysR family transcriptional regulator [Noviherbaspirillum galbum]|uniref:LysR family transcriptional regulator n=1 Tax=Noviherbaspirillum galbum TaxID=2709383 RepID=A0A6B3SYZ8_9BURK|nr:LysR family transcriptional regulator [Noviherbaspirillum galbum]NEX64192.1 LysR family transcriptional regulator [Noviherbaspirillum galbum]